MTLTITGLSKRKRRKKEKEEGDKRSRTKGGEKKSLPTGSCRKILMSTSSETTGLSARKRKKEKEKEKKFDVDIFSNHRCLCEDLAGKFVERKKGKKRKGKRADLRI